MRNQASRLSRTLLLMAALLLAGCASVTLAPTAPPPAPTDPNLVAANELAQRYPTLRGPERAQAAQAIEQLLSTVPDQALTDFAAGLPEGDPMYAHAGRVLQARGLPLPRPYDLAALWAVHAGNRPPADHDGYRPPMRLGVLLPLSGNLATAAAPVRDGLLAGYYGERRNRPELVSTTPPAEPVRPTSVR